MFASYAWKVYHTDRDNTKYQSNKNVVYSCMDHVAWCPKYRRKVIVGPVEKRLEEIVKEVASQLNVEIIEMETLPDHIH